MNKIIILIITVMMVVGTLHSANAVDTTISVVVDSKTQPWDTAINSTYSYGINDGLPPIIVDSNNGLAFNTGDTLTVTYTGGLVRAGLAWPWVDADGFTESVCRNDATCTTGNYFPSKYMMADWDTYLMALVGTFANDNGVIVGTPFEIGVGPTALIIPTGASRLQLGINDDLFKDNEGTFAVNVTGAVAPEPVSSILFLIGGTLLAGRSYLRKKV